MIGVYWKDDSGAMNKVRVKGLKIEVSRRNLVLIYCRRNQIFFLVTFPKKMIDSEKINVPTY